MTRQSDLVELEEAARAIKEFYASPRTGEWIVDTEEAETAKRLHDSAMKVLRLRN